MLRWVVSCRTPATGTTTRVHLDSFVDAEVSNLFGEIVASDVVATTIAVAVDGCCLAAGDTAGIRGRRVVGCLTQRKFDVDF